MKLFKKVFVCVVAVCTMTTITNASNMDFISKDSVAYTVNGIDAYNAPRDAAKNFDVERVIYFSTDTADTQIDLTSNTNFDNVDVVSDTDSLIAAAEADPFAAIVVDSNASSFLERDKLAGLSKEQHLILIIGYDNEDYVAKDFPASDKVNFKDYAFASYIITPDGNFQVFDFWPTSVRSIDDMLTYTNKTKDAAYTLYNLYVCDEDYSEASAAELAKAENDAAVLSQNTTAVTASQNNRVELFHTWMAGSTTGYVYTSATGSTVLKTVHNGEAIIFTGTTKVIEDSTFYQGEIWTSSGTLSTGWMAPAGSWMDYPFTCSLYDYAYNYPSEDDDGLIVFNDTYGAGYKMAKSSSLYNGSGTATTSISSYTRVWFNSDAGTAGATKPYLVTISGYSTYANNKWTYHSISATTFVDAGFNTGKVSTYKMNTLQE